ncbi:MAG TPA: hypothetical protein VHO06_26930, partial [Polyangia bacterium]|nr:hypothetical protein [Polyangia bacterium]
VAAADARVQALRAAHARADGDPRLALLQSLRGKGMPLAAALLEVERRDRGGGGSSVGPAGFEPAAYGLKV